MQQIKNIIFDYGNVIFDIDFKRLEKAFADLGIPPASQIFAQTGQHRLFDDFDIGRVDAAGFREGIRQLAEKPELTDQQIDESWNTLLVGIPPRNHDLLLRAKSNYRTFLLSNNNELHYTWIMDYLKRTFDLTGNTIFFEKDYYSHLMGMRKPHAEIFQYVLDTHGLKPEETLFIDDSPQHLAAAETLGLRTVRAINAHGLEQLLTEERLL